MGILVLAYISFYYRKTPNKRPWAFVSLIVSKRAFLAFSSFLRNEIESNGIEPKTVKKRPIVGSGWWGGAFIGRGRLLGVLRYIMQNNVLLVAPNISGVHGLSYTLSTCMYYHLDCDLFVAV